MLQITTDVFSGRPNPSWIVDEKEARDIFKEITANREVIAEVGSGYQGLGYRGVFLEPLADDLREEFDLPPSFMIANGASRDEPGGLEIAKRLVEDMPKYPARDEAAAALTPLDEEMQELLLDQMAAFPKVISEMPPKTVRFSDLRKTEESTDVTCSIELCSFNPNFWNKDRKTQEKNNCYNYGRNKKTNTFAQPGRASKYKPYPYPMRCNHIVKAAKSDGAHSFSVCFPDSERPRWLMALAVWPGTDYHWYRMHVEGFWGHKPGPSAARNTDDAGSIITDPKTCARRKYTNFCGYLTACKSMKIG